MRKQILLLTFILLAFCGLAFADEYQVNTTVVLYSDIYNNSVRYQIPNGTVNTTVWFNGTIINSSNMTFQTAGSFNGSYAANMTFYQIGDYYRAAYYYQNGQRIAESSESFRIVTNINNIAQDTEEAFEMVFSTFILFLVGLAIIALAKWMEEPIFYIFGAVYFLGSGSYMAFTDQGWSFPLFFALFGILIIYKGVGEILEQSERKKRRNDFDEIE